MIEISDDLLVLEAHGVDLKWLCRHFRAQITAKPHCPATARVEKAYRKHYSSMELLDRVG
jgi:hypothetical protein